VSPPSASAVCMQLKDRFLLWCWKLYQSRPINGDNIAFTTCAPQSGVVFTYKHDKHADRQKTELFRLLRPYNQTLHANRACPYPFCTHKLFQIRPLVSALWNYKNLVEFAPSQFFAYKSLIYKPKCCKFETLLQMGSCINDINFTEIKQGVGNFEIFAVFIFRAKNKIWTHECEIWHNASTVPNFTSNESTNQAKNLKIATWVNLMTTMLP